MSARGRGRHALLIGAVQIAVVLIAARPVVAEWSPARGLLLIGTAVTMSEKLEVIPRALVFLLDGRIRAVARTWTDLPPDATRADIVETDGFIYPGLIDLHNHPEYNAFPLWSVPRRYEDRDQWRADPRYRARVREPFEMLSEAEYLDLQAQLGKYAKLKAIVGGTTAMQGMRWHPAYSATEYLARSIEYTEVGAKPIAVSLDLPTSEAEWEATRTSVARAGAWLYHLAEGRSERARAEFPRLRAHRLVLPELVGIHALGLRQGEFVELATAGGKMVWSPLSNILLYGNTADVVAAKAAGLVISLAPDWSVSGSKSVLGELKVADLLNRTQFKNALSDRELVAMVTRNPAKALGWGTIAGQLTPGFLGDVIVVSRVAGNPYRNLIAATEEHIELVVARGEPLYGDERLMRHLQIRTESVGAATKLVRRYELLPGLPGKALVFKRPGLEGGDLGIRPLVETLATAMRFDREFLFRRIPKATILKKLLECGRPTRQATRAAFDELLECKFPGGLPPTPLDGYVTSSDDEFFRRLETATAARPSLKGLKEYYRPPAQPALGSAGRDR